MLLTSAGGLAAEKTPPPEAPAQVRKVDPTAAQTEEWLREHIEAWNDSEVHVTVKDCRIMVLDKPRERTEIVDLRGLLLPIEVIRLDNGKDATLRLRVKQKHTGTYSMFRKCGPENRYCAEPTGKFQSLPYVDLTVTSVTDFISGRRTDEDKSLRLERALEHYSRLCGAMEDARNRLF
ncbi:MULTISPECIES: hypothetical protein [unclassified Corallococcus]|uniref:hypothetical protein n=1 Tax=Corallococcus TaxID=83461 RepID=UPI001CBB628C|nr:MULTISPECIES: hypothetical protein [unclassified Corallococcus]MBZ4332338.1 hypothetical protein [Corallococcus sp. AS-1-12]MBZ4372101.1 hypothetical protein [Corallococcus sp. AS-1-6]